MGSGEWGWRMAFGERLAGLMTARGLTAYALAKRSGVTKQSLSKLLQGVHAPAWETVQRLALALGVGCAAFADPSLTLPPQAPPGNRGRPRKAAPAARAGPATPAGGRPCRRKTAAAAAGTPAAAAPPASPSGPTAQAVARAVVLTEATIMNHAAAHRRRTGRWPTAAAGPVSGVAGLTWRGVDQALRSGKGGLPGGDSLAALLARCVQQ
jgi:transcriptional regulator with XRE-family HTH domain